MSINNKLIFIFLFFVLALYSLNRHSKHQPFDYHGELYADAAGYNVYLPLVLSYNFNSRLFPIKVDSLTGGGFKIENQKVITKYSYGTALLQSPFWFISQLFSPNQPYSIVSHRFLSISAIFYLIIGLIFCYKLIILYQNKMNWWVIFYILLGTNLFEYSINSSGMSHVYSFCCFSVLLYFLEKDKINNSNSIFKISLLSGLIFVIRPANILFLMIIMGFFLVKKLEFNHLKFIIFKYFVPIFAMCLLFYIPQALYNQYAYNSFKAYSYQGEGFTYWNNPKVLRVLFSPQNGFWIYCPLIGILFFYSLKKFVKDKNHQFLLLITLTTVYVWFYSSWWSFQLGCGLGHRGFVDFMVLLIFPLLNLLKNYPKFAKTFIFVSIVYMQLITYNFDTCYPYPEWDFKRFFLFIIKG